MGPDNVGGRTRAIIFDNKDVTAKTLYAAGVDGGIFKSTNLGAIWSKVNTSNGTANLNVSCMVQASDGTIYAGTGEGLGTELYTGYAEMGFEGGFMGRGIFKSDANDNFSLIQGTQPVVNGKAVDWAFINKLAIDTHNNRLFAATQNGLRYATLPNLNDWQSECKHLVDSLIIMRDVETDSIITCDSFKIINGAYHFYGVTATGINVNLLKDDTLNVNTVYSEYVPFDQYGNVYDLKVSPDGWIITTFNGLIYVSESGSPGEFVNRSITPTNPESIRFDTLTQTSHVQIYDKAQNLLLDTTNVYAKSYGWHTNYVYLAEDVYAEYPSISNTGRVEFAIAPSDPGVVYAMATKSSAPNKNGLFNIYLSEDNGQNWRVIAPGGSTTVNILGSSYLSSAGLTQYYYQGDYTSTIIVFPDDPYHIIAGGVDLWDGKKVTSTGYYQWEKKSYNDASIVPNGIFSPYYIHSNQHIYVFRPGYGDQFFIGTDGGVFAATISQGFYQFQSKNKNFNVTQFYTLDVSNRKTEVLGGTQDNGTQYISGEGSTPNKGVDLWRAANSDPKYPEGSNGGYAAISNMREIKDNVQIDPASFYSKSSYPKNEALIDRIRRSETLGYDYSSNLFDYFADPPAPPLNDPPSKFLTPMLLWESYDNTNSRDSVTYKATQNYKADDVILARSHNFKHPIVYTLSDSLNSGDSIRIQDIISTKLFLATTNNIWMTQDAIRFDLVPDWFLISNNTHVGFTGNPNCMAYSKDANYLFVGTFDGKLYRISNIALAYNRDLADVGSADCIIATSEIQITADNSQVITSISVDPSDANKVLVTLGNYGNTDYVYYSTNALADNPVFISVQGNLPQMPVYSSVLEMQPETDIAVIGTEEGIWISDDISSKVWYESSANIAKVPVMALKQQAVSKQSVTVTYYDPAFPQDPLYDIYPDIENYGVIYAATLGRGIFRDETFLTVGTEEHHGNNITSQLDFQVYPNPASHSVNIEFKLVKSEAVQINVFNLQGKLILSLAPNTYTSGQQSLQLNIDALSRGTYVLQVVAGEKISATKLIVTD